MREVDAADNPRQAAPGRAIVRDPAAFPFDEPLSSRDAKLRVRMRLDTKQLRRRLGTTSSASPATRSRR